MPSNLSDRELISLIGRNEIIELIASCISLAAFLGGSWSIRPEKLAASKETLFELVEPTSAIVTPQRYAIYELYSRFRVGFNQEHSFSLVISADLIKKVEFDQETRERLVLVLKEFAVFLAGLLCDVISAPEEGKRAFQEEIRGLASAENEEEGIRKITQSLLNIIKELISRDLSKGG